MLGHHRHASETPLVFRWRADDGLKWYLDPLSLLKVSKKKNKKKKQKKKKKKTL